MAVERLKACDNIVACPKNWACTGVFCTNGGIKLDPVDDEAPPENSRESTLCKEVSQLKRLLAEKTMEVDFFTLVLWVRRAVAGDLHKLGPLRSAMLFVRLTAAIIVVHGVLVLFWASCYRLLRFPSWESVFYFSASSYSTAGCGDVVLPVHWRMLGPLESIIGALMSGISVSVIFATVTRLVSRETRSSH